jgi:anti-sigma regulatory factor (Ser/Thr protein kinase)
MAIIQSMSVDFDKNPAPRGARLGEVARELGISQTYVRKLADAGVLPHTVTRGGHRIFDLTQTRRAYDRRHDRILALELPITGLEEHTVWDRLQTEAPIRHATKQALEITRYGFTELLNNAIEHSGGTAVTVRWEPGPKVIRAELGDNGIGAFERIRLDLGLSNHRSALAELSKGKVTTQPNRHSGEGLFFTSRAVDYFDLQANGLRWTVDNRLGDFALGASSYAPGTLAVVEVDPTTTRSLEELFKGYTNDEMQFSRTTARVKLFERGSSFVSRSEAKRLLAGLERFPEVQLDFEKVDSVGQGFADEVFAVWAQQHPEVRLEPINMNDGVALMVGRAAARRENRTAKQSGG